MRNSRGWLDEARAAGPLFRPVHRPGRISPSRLSPPGANLVVQRAVVRTGTDPRPYSAHSLRAGLATAAAQVGL